MLDRTVRRTLLLVALALSPGLARASEIVDTAYVIEAQKRGAIVWDVRDAELYRSGHIPGAVNVGHIGRMLRDANREDWLPVRDLERILGGAGIDLLNKEVIVYDRKGDPLAYFGLSTLHYLDARNPKVYHGGIEDWKAAKQPVATDVVRLAPVALKLSPRAERFVWTDEMIAKSKAGNVQIVDARTAKEFSGEDIRAIRGGHIPGAVNIPFEQNWIDPGAAGRIARKEINHRDGMTLKPVDELRNVYAALDPAKETIVYCQSGVRAAETATVMRSLGFANVKVYDSSWVVYGATLAAPAENEQFVNIGAINARIAGLQGRVDELESEIEALRSKGRRLSSTP
jgi:thiosulfate/3-mercaptopyruvate sulfurtransferase